MPALTLDRAPHQDSASLGTPGEETLRQLLRNSKLRVTVARIKVLQTIATKTMYADALARDMFLMGERFSVSTVYRVLHELEQKGLLIREIGLDRKLTYRLKPEDAAPASCQLTCLESGQTVIFDDPQLRQRLGELLQLHGLQNQKGLFVLEASIDMMLAPQQG